MAYTPPAKDAANGLFSEAYTPPAKDAVDGNITSGGLPQTVFATGFEATEFGSLLATWDQYPVVTGLDSLEFSSSRLSPYASQSANFTQAYVAPEPSPLNIDFAVPYGTLAPSGWLSSAFGTTEIAIDADFLFASGWESAEYGEPTLSLTIKPSGFTGTAYGTPQDVDYAIRYRVFDGISDLAFGTATIGTRQFAYPLGSTHTLFGTQFISDGVRTVTVNGYDATEFGAADIDYVRLRPSGWDSLELGESHEIKLGSRFLLATGWVASGLGSAEIYNQTTYVSPYSIPQLAAQEPASFGEALLTGPSDPLQVSGWNSALYGYTLIETPQRPLVPSGWDDNAVGGPEIGYSIRSILVNGFDAALYPSSTIIYNDDLAAAPTGWDSQEFGAADIRDRAQTVRVDTLWADDGYGTPFIADAIRYLGVFQPPEPVVPIGPHDIQLKQRFLTPTGIDSLLIPPPLARQFRLTLIPASIGTPTAYGSPTITNRNYEIRNNSETFTEYGSARIYKSKLEVTGFTTMVFGTTVIRERTQRVQAVGWGSLVMALGSIRRDPEPPAVQRLRPSGWDSLDTDADDGHQISANSLYPSGWQSSAFGLAIAELRALRPTGWIDSDTFDLFGTPYLSYDQRAYPVGFQYEPYALQVPEPRLSPNYIFAPRSDTPVDDNVEKMGRPDLTDGTRTVTQIWPSLWTQMSTYGTPRADLKNRKVFPNGLNAFKYGRPVMGGGISSYGVNPAEEDTGYGAPTIAHVPVYSPYLYPTGFEATAFTGPRIELKNRAVAPSGFTATDMPVVISSPSGVYYTPLTYGPAEGFDATLWGEGTFIADRIRYVYPSGWTATDQKPVYPLHASARRRPGGTTPVHALR